MTLVWVARLAIQRPVSVAHLLGIYGATQLDARVGFGVFVGLRVLVGALVRVGAFVRVAFAGTVAAAVGVTPINC